MNTGAQEPVPEHPYPGQQWKEVRHDKTVTWLAFWKDPISQKDFKYVWLAANSTFKSDSDLAKYEKARKLKVKPVLHHHMQASLGFAAELLPLPVVWCFWGSGSVLPFSVSPHVPALDTHCWQTSVQNSFCL